ncbi:MAG: hypothetical protein JNK11_18385, partial [Alphaproteobacteria bacterium]|nr:hypothetical protein [Alphaproteobacteria bacterium]
NNIEHPNDADGWIVGGGFNLFTGVGLSVSLDGQYQSRQDLNIGTGSLTGRMQF